MMYLSNNDSVHFEPRTFKIIKFELKTLKIPSTCIYSHYNM